MFCFAYNHADYIKKTLDSILKQRTNFRFEIIVHDDASQDETVSIIEDYVKKFPEIIKPIFQQENQYSKGISILHTFMLPYARGKYFAFCECDDYWINPDKLQIQYNFMENNVDYTLCIHNAITVNTIGKTIGKVCPVNANRTIKCAEMILGGGEFCATNSLFTKTDYLRNSPEYIKKFDLDYLWQIYLASLGKTYCFSGNMSAYRVNQESSWTGKMKKDMPAYWRFLDTLDNAMNDFDEYTKYTYHDEIERAKNKRMIMAFLQEENYEKLAKPEYKRIWRGGGGML